MCVRDHAKPISEPASMTSDAKAPRRHEGAALFSYGITIIYR
jgi:hypothetical protein